MKFVSTRRKAPSVDFIGAVRSGLASDGGLYVPERLPDFTNEMTELTRLASSAPAPHGFAEFAARVLRPFAASAGDLPAICQRALSFPLPCVSLDPTTAVLELFHGPTAAFKDVGARFLAEWALAAPRAPGADSTSPTRTVLVATSGDTGGAVASAFFGKPGIEVFILFPRGKISARQEKQLTAWGGNVRAFSVRGDFDDCQRVVKEAFHDPAWAARGLISANSINMGRILPQVLYYAHAALALRARAGGHTGFIVPTGNLGNALAALWAKQMGFPISQVVFALNSNRPVARYLETGQWNPEPTRSTLANAMDVGNPSNMERLRALYPQLSELQRDARAFTASDDEIRETLARKPWGRAWCPHTATAIGALEKLRETSPAHAKQHWTFVATAHPAKFDTIVEPLIGESIEVPAELQRLLNQPSRSTEIEPTLKSFTDAV